MFLAALLLTAAPAPPDAAFAAVLGRAAPAVVTVRVARDRRGGRGPFAVAAAEVLAEQSGVIVVGPAGEPVVLTVLAAAAFAPTAADIAAGTVPADAPRAVVRFAGGRTAPVAVLAADPQSGLAALSFVEPPGEVAAVSLSTDAPPGVGTSVWTLHHDAGPANGPLVAVRGIFATGRSFPPTEAGPIWTGAEPGAGALHMFGTLLELTPPPPPGSSGGGVSDAAGAVVGLVVESADGAALPPRALPLTGAFRRIVDALLAGGPVRYGLLGVEPTDVSADAAFAVLGDEAPAGAAAVGTVRGDSPAERAGVRRGDWVVGVIGADGAEIPVRSAVDLVRVVSLSPPGSSLTLDLLDPRSGERRRATAELVAAGPVPGGWPAVASRPAGAAARGVRVDWPTARLPLPPGEPFPLGVVVTETIGGPLRVGDRVLSVGGGAVFSPAGFVAAVDGSDSPATLELADGRTVTLPPP